MRNGEPLKRSGMSLAELLIGMVILAIVGLGMTRIMSSQARYFDHQKTANLARSVSRGPLNRVVSDLRMVEARGGVISASPSTIEMRVPYAIGVVLQNGFAMAGRQRSPVRITFYPSTKSYVFTDRESGQVLQTRKLSSGNEYSVTSLSSTASEVDVLPNGIGSVSFVVTVANGAYSRRVSATSAGFVRMTPQ